MQAKNRFAGATTFDSDDDVPAQKITKTQKKKEERKVEAPAKVVKVNTNQMGEGGFEMVNNQRPQTAARGRGGRGGGGRGGDRPRTAGRGGGDRPQGQRPPRLDQDGNPIRGARGGRGAQRGGDRGGRGNFTGEGKEGDRKDRTGRANRGNKKDGEGRANWGGDNEREYKKKSADEATEPVEEVKVARDPSPQYIEEIIGVSLDDFFKGYKGTQKKEARAAEGIKGEKTKASDGGKTHQETVQKNQYLKGTVAKTADVNNNMFGFGAAPEDEPVESSRGGRGGRGRGARGGGSIVNQGGRRQNAKQALKKTDDDFPTL